MTAALAPVVVTRAEGHDGPLTRELRGLGIPVLAWPAVGVTAAATPALAAALGRVTDFAWIVFTSRHAVAAVLQALPAPPAGVRIAAVGAATAHVLQQRGWPVDLVPAEPGAAGLVSSFAARWSKEDDGLRVLYPASSRALPTLRQGLTQLGAVVTQVEAYRTEGTELDLPACRDWIARGTIGAVTFASPSAVSELAQALGRDDFARLFAGAAAVAIGRTTARELATHGQNAVVADSATLHSLAVTTLRLLQTRA
jgi:uroporphyrinogen-III synthase